MRKKSEKRRQSILDTASAVFREVGYENASMAEISSRLGSSKATIYNYFSSKEEIFAEVLTRQIGADLQATLSPRVAGESGELAAVLRRVGREYLNVMLRSDVIAVRRLVNYHAERSNLGRLIYENGPLKGWQPVADLFSQRMNAGELRQADAWLMAMQFRALLEAEWLEKRLLGVVVDVGDAELNESVAQAVEAFSRIYGVGVN